MDNLLNGGWICLLYTSDAADDPASVDLGGRRIIKKIFFKQKTAYEIPCRLVGSEMCIRDSLNTPPYIAVQHKYSLQYQPYYISFPSFRQAFFAAFAFFIGSIFGLYTVFSTLILKLSTFCW